MSDSIISFIAVNYNFPEFIWETPIEHGNKAIQFFNQAWENQSGSDIIAGIGHTIVAIIDCIPVVGQIAVIIEIIAFKIFGASQSNIPIQQNFQNRINPKACIEKPSEVIENFIAENLKNTFTSEEIEHICNEMETSSGEHKADIQKLVDAWWDLIENEEETYKALEIFFSLEKYLYDKDETKDKRKTLKFIFPSPSENGDEILSKKYPQHMLTLLSNHSEYFKALASGKFDDSWKKNGIKLEAISHENFIDILAILQPNLSGMSVINLKEMEFEQVNEIMFAASTYEFSSVLDKCERRLIKLIKTTKKDEENFEGVIDFLKFNQENGIPVNKDLIKKAEEFANDYLWSCRDNKQEYHKALQGLGTLSMENLRLHPDTTDEDLAFLPRKTKGLELAFCDKVTENGFKKYICELKTLEHFSYELDSQESQLKNFQGLETIPTFKSFSVKLRNGDDKPIEKVQLPHFENLEKLSLGYCTTNISDFGVFKNLKSIDLENYVNDQEFIDLGTSVNLNEIIINHCSFKRIEGLSKLENLKLLHVENCNEFNNLSGLEQLSQLENLTLSHLQKYLDNLPKLNSLKVLNLNVNLPKINLDNYENLEELDVRYHSGEIIFSKILPNLRILNAYHQSINGDLNHLPKLEKLETLAFSVTFPALKNLKELWLRPKDQTDVTSINLENLPQLEILNLSFMNQQIKVDGIEKLINLKQLDLFSPNIKNLLIFEQLTNLKYLYIGKWEEKIEIDLSKFSSLKTFSIFLSGISNIVSSSQSEQLTMLNIMQCTHLETIENIENLQKLEELHLQGCKNLRNVSNLDKLNNLKTINARITKLNPAVLSQLKNRGITVLV